MRTKRLKIGCRTFVADAERLRQAAQRAGLTMDVRRVRCGRRDTYHVMFLRAGKHVLHYWPGTGTTYSLVTGAKGTAADCWAAMQQATDEAEALGTHATNGAVGDRGPHGGAT